MILTGRLPVDRQESEWGNRLHQVLFSGPVRDLMQRSCEVARGNKQWVQLSLQTDPNDPHLAWLEDVEWELLHDDDQGFLGLHPDWTIVRYLHSSFRPEPISFAAPLRILVVIANPAGLQSLDVEKERRGIEAAWQDLDGVHVTFLQPPTVYALNRSLAREAPFHVVHFIGHGTFDKSNGKGYLLLEDDSRAVNLVEGQVLATHMQGRQAPSLVVLNACHTATNGPKPLSAVAASLVRRAGIPAVLAMKAPILNAAAIDFSMALHEALAAGKPVDLAVTAGRSALHARHPDRFDWAIPSLYLRTARSQLIEQPAGRFEEPPSRKPEPRLRIEGRVEIGTIDARHATFAEKLIEGRAVASVPDPSGVIVTETRVDQIVADKFDRAGLVVRDQRDPEK